MIILWGLALAASVAAQDEEEILFTGPVTHGGFGAPVVKFTKVREDMAVLVGGRGGWIINHCLSIGGGGYGLVNEIQAPADGFRGLVLGMGYGGFEIEYIHRSHKLVHAAMSLLIGGGGAGYREPWDEGWDGDSRRVNDWDSFFVAEPSLAMELNVSRFFRIHFGASYRFVSGAGKFDLTNEDLGGPSLVLALKFGKF
jgi:hypothetical protein